MTILSGQYGVLPGVGDESFTFDNAFCWGPGEYNRAFLVHGLLLGSSVDAGNTGATNVLRAGLTLGVVTASKKFTQWTTGQTNGSEDIRGFLMKTVELDGTNDVHVPILIGGNIKASKIIVTGQANPGITAPMVTLLVDHPRFFLDDEIYR